MCDWMKIHFINKAQHLATSRVWFCDPPPFVSAAKESKRR